MEVTEEFKEEAQKLADGVSLLLNGKDLSMAISVLTFLVIDLCKETGAVNNPEYVSWVFTVLDNVRDSLLGSMTTEEGVGGA